MPRETFEAACAARRAALRLDLADLAAAVPPLVLEVGCGNGHFLTAFAAEHPTETCIGVDLRLERIVKARRKQERARLGNVRFVRAEAMDFLEELPAGVRLRDIYMLFPDPWPKKRHHKNRLFNPQFLDALGRRAIQGTRLFFRTDYKPYYIEAEQMVASHRGWHQLPPSPFAFEHPTIFQSRADVYHSLAAIWRPESGKKQP